MIITKGATTDGSMIVTHSDDDELGDQRIISVPANDTPYKPNERRDIFAEHYKYPRINTKNRGPNYYRPGFDLTQPIGTIPQVENTYAYFDGNYGIMNEHNLMIGECTNGAYYQPDYVTADDAKKYNKHIRLFYSSELSRVALERCTGAREAIKLMGSLIEEYGFYSTGETLLVADEKEAWVFEMCALPDEEYHSAWVAQRVPDGEVFVAANEFRIRNIIEDDPDNFMYSQLLKPGLQKTGWWKPGDGELDWLKAVSPGEYNHPYYSLRRVWRVLDRVNPDLCLSPWVEDGYTTDYPFSIKPQRKLSLSDIFSLYRDHYEGTQFDLTKGVAAGPYNDPHRFVGTYDGKQNNITEDKKFYGAWERSISVFYQGYTYVNQIRPNASEALKGIVWFGPDVSYTTCFAPLPVQVNNIPEIYQKGDPQIFSRDSAWWVFNFVAGWSRLNFKRITSNDIIPLQKELEQKEFTKISKWDEKIKNKTADEAKIILIALSKRNAKKVFSQWWKMADMLVAKYSDGYMNLPELETPINIGYSSEWLNVTNYKDGPDSYDMK